MPVSRGRRSRKISYEDVVEAARPHHLDLLRHWLPDGRLKGPEWESRNPTREDRSLGSFKCNVHSGKWADFATGDKGGDIISLAAYLFSCSQWEAARGIARMIGLSTSEAHHG